MAQDNKIIVELIVEGTGQLKAELASSKESVEEFNKEVKNTEVGTKYASNTIKGLGKEFGTIRQMMRETSNELAGLNLELSEMQDAGKRGTKEYIELEKKMAVLQDRAGQLKDAMLDANEQIKATGSDTRGLDRALRVVSAASSGFQVFEGAAILAGKGSENLQKALVKLNAVMAITSGLQQVATELSRQDSILKPILTKSTQAYNLVVGQSAGALKAFRLALAATGIGLAVVAIIALVENWDKLKGAINGTNNELKTNSDLKKKQLEIMEQTDKAFDNEIKKLKLQGVEERELIKLQRQRILEKIQLAKAAIEADLQVLDLQATAFAKGQALSQLPIVGGLIGLLFPSQEELSQQVSAANAQKAILQDLEGQLLDLDLTAKETVKNVETETTKAVGTGGIINFILYGKADGQAKADKGIDDFKKKMEEIRRAASGGITERATGGATRGDILQQQFEKAQDYYSKIQETISQTSNLISNASQIRAQNEIAALDKKRARGLITEKQYEKEVAKIKTEAAQKQRRADVINAFAMIPMAVLSAFTNTISGLPGKFIAAAVAGVFATAQAGLIAAAPLPKFRDGGSVAKRLGLIHGKSHEQGGVPIEVEGNEYVMNTKAVRKYGVDFMDSINNLKLSPVVTMQNKMDALKQTDYKLYEHLSTLGSYMKQDYRANERGNDYLKQLVEQARYNKTTYV